MVANKYAFLQITRRRFLNEWEAFKKVISRRNIRRRITDRKSGSAGMPRPISYAVFCLKKKRSRYNACSSSGSAERSDLGDCLQRKDKLRQKRVRAPTQN